MRMMRDLLLVKIDKVDKTKGGIYYADENQAKLDREAITGIVVEAGKDCEDVKVGERVMYKNYVGNELKAEELDDKETFMVVAEVDILAVLKGGIAES